jgi:hypothetical protein
MRHVADFLAFAALFAVIMLAYALFADPMFPTL